MSFSADFSTLDGCNVVSVDVGSVETETRRAMAFLIDDLTWSVKLSSNFFVSRTISISSRSSCLNFPSTIKTMLIVAEP